MVASAVGGIQDQIVDGQDGLLVSDPADTAAFGAAVRRLLTGPALGRRLGQAAHRRVREEFLDDRHTGQYVALFDAMLAG